MSFLQRGISIGPSSICIWAVVGYGFLFWPLSGLFFLQNGPFVFIVQLFHSQSGWIPTSCGYRRSSSYLLDVCPRLNFVAVDTLVLVWSSREGIGIVVFLALTVLGSEVVLLEARNRAGGLSLEILKTHKPGQSGVVSAQVELLCV
jgi:hypothetical protein